MAAKFADGREWLTAGKFAIPRGEMPIYVYSISLLLSSLVWGNCPKQLFQSSGAAYLTPIRMVFLASLAGETNRTNGGASLRSWLGQIQRFDSNYFGEGRIQSKDTSETMRRLADLGFVEASGSEGNRRYQLSHFGNAALANHFHVLDRAANIGEKLRGETRSPVPLLNLVPTEAPVDKILSIGEDRAVARFIILNLLRTDVSVSAAHLWQLLNEHFSENGLWAHNTPNRGSPQQLATLLRECEDGGLIESQSRANRQKFFRLSSDSISTIYRWRAFATKLFLTAGQGKLVDAR